MAKKQKNKPVANVAAPPQTIPAPVVERKKNTPEMISIKNLSIILAVITFLLYANTIQNGYVLDDKIVLTSNTEVTKGLKGIPGLLSTPRTLGSSNVQNDFYRPLSQVMFAIEYQFFGENPAVGHFFNILVFAGCVIMLFLFLNKFFEGKKPAIAFVAALLFAAHPVHTEVVANIKSRDELLCYFFSFWSLNLFMVYVKNGQLNKLLFGVSTLFLAYLSKETVITFLAVIPVLFFLYNNENKKRSLYITIGTAAVTLTFLIIRTVILNKYSQGKINTGIDFMENALAGAPSAATRVATEFLVLGKYLKLLFIPYPLLCNYSFNSIPFTGFGNVWVLISLAVYSFLAFWGLYLLIKKKKDPWAFANFFYLVTLSLFSNIPFLIGAEMAERFLFFASTGFCMAVALAMGQWTIKGDPANIMALKNVKVMAVLVPVLLVFSGLTIARNADWKDEYTLYKNDAEKSPQDSRLDLWLGRTIAEYMYSNETDTLRQRELDRESIGYLEHALEIMPGNNIAEVELGMVYLREHNYKEAVKYYIQSLATDSLDPKAINNLAAAYYSGGKYREAIIYLKRLEKFHPGFKLANFNLADSYLQLGKYDSSALYFNKVAPGDPNYVLAQYGLAKVYVAEQNNDSLELHFQKIIAVNPGDPYPIYNLGTAYIKDKKYPAAIEQFKKAIALNPNFMEAYANLGHTYFYEQKYKEAIDAFNKAHSLDPKNADVIDYLAKAQKKG